MTRQSLFACCLVLLCGIAAAADAPPSNLSAAQIVDRNVAARGGVEAWRAVNTLTLSGKVEAGGKQNTALPIVMRMKRGHMSRMEVTFKEQTSVQVYDGAHGWKVRPFLNRNEVEPFSPAEAKAAATWEDLDGPLIDHAKKGTKVELAGTEQVEGQQAYKLKLTTKDGLQRYLWVDAKSFLELKLEGQPEKVAGKMKKVAVFYRDYRREAGGVTMPRVVETVVEGAKQSHKMTVERVAVNEAMQDALFQKPQLALATQAR